MQRLKLYLFSNDFMYLNWHSPFK